MPTTFYYLSGLYREVQSIEVSPEEELKLFTFLSNSPNHFRTIVEVEIQRAFILWKERRGKNP